MITTYLQSKSSIKFEPEIVVIAGSSTDGLLADQFPMTYSLNSEQALYQLVNESTTSISVDEPFQTASVSD